MGNNFWDFLIASLEDEALPKRRLPFNPLYTGGLFHCYMLDESICQFRGVGSILPLLQIFDGKYYSQTM